MWEGLETCYTGCGDEKSSKKVKRNNGHEHSDEAIKQRGEIFTPTKLVNEMLDKLPSELFTNHDKTFLDNSCGNGQFLYQVMIRKMKTLSKKTDITLYNAHQKALSTIYGIELDTANAEACRQRLLKGSDSKELREIVNHNIICADGLDQNHEGWKGIGFYWDESIQPIVQEKKVVEKKILPKIKDVQTVKPTLIVVSTISANKFLSDMEDQIARGETW